MHKVFNKNDYPNKQVQKQWLELIGLGHFFDKELAQGKQCMQIVINAINGKN